MLKHRNVVVLSLLLGASTLLTEQSPVTQAVKLTKNKKTKDEDAEADDDDSKPSKNHPPKEVSHFTQDKVKAWKKRSWWKDNAVPTTPSYNDGDEEAYGHPSGSTFVQKEQNNKWTDGNGYGSEKVDYWWHIDRHQGDPGEDYKFDDKARKPTKELSSWNHQDGEPTSHPMGITAQINKPNNMAQWWTHGNGQGSEKWDHVEEAARFVDTQEAFHQKMKQGNFLPNMNQGDEEPTGHPMGINAQVNEPNSMAQWWTHGNGQGSEKWDHVEEAARFVNSQEEFHQKMKQGNFLPNMNHGDEEPTDHPMGITAQLNEPNNKRMFDLAQKQAEWWTQGNGQGSEKWDHVEEAARFSNSQEEFHQKMKQGNFVPSVNGEDDEPQGHPMGITAQTGSRVQTGAKALAGAQAQWWSFQGNGGGSEKWDAFEEAARFSKDGDDFDHKVQLQGYFMPSENAGNSEPTGHPMGFSFVQNDTPHSVNLVQVQRPETDHERFWMNIEGENSKDEKEFNQKAQNIKLPAGNDEDSPPPMPKQ